MLGAYIPSFEEEDLHSLFINLPMKELLDEYSCALCASDLYFMGSEALAVSPIHEFLDGVIEIMEACISERVCMAYGVPLRPTAVAGAGEAGCLSSNGLTSRTGACSTT